MDRPKLVTHDPLEPISPVVAGDVYEFTHNILTRGGDILPKGSKLTVVEPTGQTPYGEIGPAGVNWKCDAANGFTVWATLEQCISRGVLVKVSP